MKQLIEILQNEKISHRTKRFVCAIYALPVVKGSREIDVSVFADFLGERKSDIIVCCKELENYGISFIEETEAGESYPFHIGVNEYYTEIVIKLIP